MNKENTEKEYKAKAECVTIAYDVGISSIGVSEVHEFKGRKPEVKLGVRTFKAGESAKARGESRRSRRNITRKNGRKETMKFIFDEQGLIPLEESSKENYLRIGSSKKNPITIWDIRNKGLEEELTNKELLQCMTHMAKNRGNFLYEHINFESSNGGITKGALIEAILNMFESFVKFKENSDIIDSFKKDVIVDEIFKENNDENKDKLKKADFKKYLADEKDKESLDNIHSIFKFFTNCKANLSFIDGWNFESEDGKAITKNAVELAEAVDELEAGSSLAQLMNLYNKVYIYLIIKDYGYVCRVAKAKMEKHAEILKENTQWKRENGSKSNCKAFEDYEKNVKGLMSSTRLKNHANSLKPVRNMLNNYPNGLILKEARAILRKQQEYNARITDEFIAKVIAVLEGRIPFYVGPLGEDSPYAWCEKNGNFKYSYLTSEKCVNEAATMKNFKQCMQSKCNYLPEEFALPKGSLVLETQIILNELNVLTALKDEEPYYLTFEDKVNIIDNLFMKKNEVTYKNVKKLLDLDYFGTQSGDDGKKFNAKYSVYPKVADILGKDFKLESIADILTETEKVDRIESVILSLNMLSERKIKKQYFEEMNLGNSKKESSAIAESLSKLSVKGFGKLSKKFILDTPLNKSGDSLLCIMFASNTKDDCHGINQILFQAEDEHGNALDFKEGKWEKLLKENPDISFAELMNRKDVASSMPISRTVVRALNEAINQYKRDISRLGHAPDRVIIETARDLTGKPSSKKQNKSRIQRLEDIFISMKKKYAQEAGKKNDIEKVSEESRWWNKNMPDTWSDFVSMFAFIRNEGTRLQIMELYLSQGGYDLVTGQKVDIHNCERDHILYRGFGDNSMDNMCLENKMTNDKKGNHVPIEYIYDNADNIEEARKKVQAYHKRVNYCKKLGLISDKKVERLLLESSKDVFEFINKNLVDTNWIIKEFVGFLKAYNKLKGYNVKVVCMSSSFTALGRSIFGFNKDRNLGNQHHAYDAAVLCIMDGCLREFYPGYETGHGNQARYQEFYKMVVRNEEKQADKKENAKLYSFIRKAYNLHFNDRYTVDNPDSFIMDIKRTIPYRSQKSLKKRTGQLFNATLEPPRPENASEHELLDLLGINNKICSHSSLHSFALDVYEYTVFEKKGEKKHLAKKQAFIFLPRCIVDSKGHINKDKYLLVANWFSMPDKKSREIFYKEFVKQNRVIGDFNNTDKYSVHGELLDMHTGQIRKNVRFNRFYNGDMVYDTGSNMISYISGGGPKKGDAFLYSMNTFSLAEIEKHAARFKKAVTDTVKDLENKQVLESTLRNERLNFIREKIAKLPEKDQGKALELFESHLPKKAPETIYDIPYEDIADYVIENVIHIQTKNVYTRQTSDKDRHNAYIAVCSAVQDKIYSWSKVQGYKYGSFKGYKGLFETLAYCSLLMEQPNIIQSLGLKRTLKSSSVDSNKNLVKIIPLNPLNKKGKVESCH